MILWRRGLGRGAIRLLREISLASQSIATDRGPPRRIGCGSRPGRTRSRACTGERDMAKYGKTTFSNAHFAYIDNLSVDDSDFDTSYRVTLNWQDGETGPIPANATLFAIG